MWYPWEPENFSLTLSPRSNTQGVASFVQTSSAQCAMKVVMVVVCVCVVMVAVVE